MPNHAPSAPWHGGRPSPSWPDRSLYRLAFDRAREIAATAGPEGDRPGRIRAEVMGGLRRAGALEAGDHRAEGIVRAALRAAAERRAS